MTDHALRRSDALHVRLRPYEREDCELAARLERRTLSEWVRAVLTEAAQRQLARDRRVSP